MGCGISKAKVTPKQQKPEDDLHYDKLDHFKDHGTSIGNEPFILESFDLELQHKDGKVLSVIINADEISAAKFSKLTSLMPEKWLSQGLQENLNKTDKISKLSLKLQPNPLEKFNKEPFNWTSNAFDQPLKAELVHLLSFTDNNELIVKNLNNYTPTKLRFMSTDRQFFEYSE